MEETLLAFALRNLAQKCLNRDVSSLSADEFNLYGRIALSVIVSHNEYGRLYEQEQRRLGYQFVEGQWRTPTGRTQ